MTKDQRELRILLYAEEIGHVSKACRYFGIGIDGLLANERGVLFQLIAILAGLIVVGGDPSRL